MIAYYYNITQPAHTDSHINPILPYYLLVCDSQAIAVLQTLYLLLEHNALKPLRNYRWSEHVIYLMCMAIVKCLFTN